MQAALFSCSIHTYIHFVKPFIKNDDILLCNATWATQHPDFIYIPFDAACGVKVRLSKQRVQFQYILPAAEIEYPYAFNPGLIGACPDGTYTLTTMTHDALLCSVRASKLKYGVSEIFLQQINTDGAVRCIGHIAPPSSWSFEDVRLFPYNGKLCMYGTCIYKYTPGVKTKTLCAWWCINERNVTIPYYGKNHTDGPEKNWGFFDAGAGRLYAVYSHTPWVVIDCTNPTDVREVVRQEWSAPVNLNGGAPPLRWRGRWWSFCHTSTSGAFDTYVVTFDPDTWLPTHCGRLFGGIDFSGISHMFAYVVGAVAVGEDSIRLSAGINDTAMGLFRFSAAEIDACLQPIGA